VTASDDSDELVRRAAAGEGAAFATLVERWKERAIRTAYHLTGSWSDADDVAQEAFLRAYRGLGGFDRRSAFGTWLHRIVVNCGLNHLRSRRRAQARVAEAPRPERAEAGRAEARQEVTLVLEALADMTPALRVTLILATLERMSYRDIAAALEIPEGTVAWRVNQARKLLRVKLSGLPRDQEAAAPPVVKEGKRR
jgi:RNA polymerase sigma-70 factor (ECF subfamily)